MLIKKVIILIIVLLFPLISLSLPKTALAQSDLSIETIKVAIYENPPKIFTENGQARGFWPDIINYIAEEEGWEVDYVSGSFEDGLNRLNNGEVDVMVDVGYSIERSRIYDFSTETAFINWAGVYSSQDLNVESFADLDGKSIAVLDGDIHFSGPLGINVLMNSFGYSATYLHVASYEEVLTAVSDGRADIGIVNRLFGSHSEADYDVKRTGLVFNPIELKFAFTKDTQKTNDLLPIFDKHLMDLKDQNDSIYYKSIIQNLEGYVREVEVAPSWIRPLLLTVVGAIGLFILIIAGLRQYQIILKKQVKRKTEEVLKQQTRFQEMADLLPQSVFETNMHGEISYVNNYTAKLFGYDKNKLESGFDFFQLFEASSADKLREAMQNNSTKEIVNHEFTSIKSDGTKFPANVFFSSINHDDKVQGTRGVITDMTEQKENEARYKTSIEEIDRLIKSTIDREAKMSELKDMLDKFNQEEKTNSQSILQ